MHFVLHRSIQIFNNMTFHIILMYIYSMDILYFQFQESTAKIHILMHNFDKVVEPERSYSHAQVLSQTFFSL